jgi:hypothetical protein
MEKERLHIKAHSSGKDYQPFDFAQSSESYGALATLVGYDTVAEKPLSVVIDSGRKTVVNTDDSMTLVGGMQVEFFW